jgi:small-conductance mechanosensitive channel
VRVINIMDFPGALHPKVRMPSFAYMFHLPETPLFQIGTRVVTGEQAVDVLLVAVLTFLVLRIIRAVMMRRAKANPAQASRLHSGHLLAKYTVWIAAIFLTLDALNINLTFLLAGSAALLVGLGLGMQQTFNDIVSGIIILMEGTIRVGDVLEVEGLVGRVTKINLRTSTVYSRDGMNVIVPNHRFINENVVNWSHNALETRFRLSVGVAYGSDERLVRQILEACALEQEEVISNDPEHPVRVRLIDFGESALKFDVLFWSQNIFMIEQTKSHIRFRILERFREAGFAIPFPQRDLHIIPPKT